MIKKTLFEISSEKTHLTIDRELPILDFVNCKTILTHHIDRILSIAIWKNCFLLTASEDNKIQIYNILTSKKIGQLPSFDDPVISLEIIEYLNYSFLISSDLCQRIFLVNLRKKTLICHHNHTTDILQMIYLKDTRNVLFCDTLGRIYSWDFRKNHTTEHIIEKRQGNAIISSLKFLDEDKKTICISSYSGQVFILQVQFNGKDIKTLEVKKTIKFHENICSMNYCKSLNKIFLGTNDASIRILNLNDKNNNVLEETNEIHELFCSKGSEISEIVVIEGGNSSCWGIAVTNFDRKLFIVDFKNKINYEVRNPLIAVFYYSVKSKIELFVKNQHLYMAVVSQEAEIVLFYEIIH